MWSCLPVSRLIVNVYIQLSNRPQPGNSGHGATLALIIVGCVLGVVLIIGITFALYKFICSEYSVAVG